MERLFSTRCPFTAELTAPFPRPWGPGEGPSNLCFITAGELQPERSGIFTCEVPGVYYLVYHVHCKTVGCSV